ncbi:MAG TPA: TRAP transporter small permease subunit [Ottowia sp.]|uniref:TRAP transporter small permease subunit n=1 Tax=Ottowia sp. TaxID=1898956 RepID=UPI002CFEBDD2|nr:TRAP transporter small permease subunit [Ottowia sp.]HMN21173.1 TRAP transporter small permease subunit [Ottowia sp.]
MPALTFVLPHWLYWSGLIVFPLVAMWLVRRQERRGPGPRPSKFLAYLFWLCSGFLGLHRFYLRNLWGFVFVALFVGILYANGHIHEERENVSRTRAEALKATTALERAQKRVDADAASVDAAELEQLRATARQAKAGHDAAEGDMAYWRNVITGTGGVIGVLLLIDAFLLPGLVRKRRAIEMGAQAAAPTDIGAVDPGSNVAAKDAALRRGYPAATRWIDSMNGWIGEYVSYWAILAVFLYYYEVLARYVLNSPTNWVHESMFLMFGMQYALCGAYGYRDDSHVRVDILYTRLSPRGKAACDVLTSVFFFIFTITLLVTGWRFAMDSVGVGETSFTEWGIQYWPVKLMLPIGALLIVLQGIARLARDIGVLIGRIPVVTAQEV